MQLRVLDALFSSVAYLKRCVALVVLLCFPFSSLLFASLKDLIPPSFGGRLIVGHIVRSRYSAFACREAAGRMTTSACVLMCVAPDLTLRAGESIPHFPPDLLIPSGFLLAPSDTLAIVISSRTTLRTFTDVLTCVAPQRTLCVI